MFYWSDADKMGGGSVISGKSIPFAVQLNNGAAHCDFGRRHSEQYASFCIRASQGECPQTEETDGMKDRTEHDWQNTYGKENWMHVATSHETETWVDQSVIGRTQNLGLPRVL